MTSGKANSQSREYICDCCGTKMYTHLCKINCPNCGYRFDCSDLTLNFDPIPENYAPNAAERTHDSSPDLQG